MKRMIGYLDIMLAVPFLIASLLSLWGAVETWDRLAAEPEDFQISLVLFGLSAWVGISALLAGRVLISGAAGRLSATRVLRVSVVALLMLVLAFAIGLADDDPVSRVLLFLLIPAAVLFAVTCFFLKQLSVGQGAAIS